VSVVAETAAPLSTRDALQGSSRPDQQSPNLKSNPTAEPSTDPSPESATAAAARPIPSVALDNAGDDATGFYVPDEVVSEKPAVETAQTSDAAADPSLNGPEVQPAETGDPLAAAAQPAEEKPAAE